MGNVLRILKRDAMRLLRAPAAIVVVVALLILPSAYTWYNVLAFWDPYEDTGNLSVCVVNQDKGTTNDIVGELNIGDRITEELLANEDLNWIEDDYETAMSKLKSGEVYAAYVIPEDFSECIVSPLSGTVKHPQLQYYVNEKLGPVSPKITDTGAQSLEQIINSKYVETVSDVAVETVDEKLQGAESKIVASESEAASRVGQAVTSIAQMRESLASVEQVVKDAQTKVAAARSALDTAETLLQDSIAVLRDIDAQAATAQASLAAVSSGAAADLPNVMGTIAQVSAQANEVAAGLTTSTTVAQSDVTTALNQAQSAVSNAYDVADDLQSAASQMGDGTPGKEQLVQLAQDLNTSSAALQQQVDAASGLDASVANASQSLLNASSSLQGSAQNSVEAAQQYSNELLTDAIPAINNCLAQLSVASSDLWAVATSQQAILEQTRIGLDQLDSVLATSQEALSQTDSLMAALQDDLNQVASDVLTLGSSGVITSLVENGTLNSKTISEFMGSPTQLETISLYHPNAYGSAMAPLFMSLTFWIGAFMLVIIMRQEVDSEGIGRTRSWQRYLSRFILFAILAVAQSAICSAGVLALGVQAVEVPALFVASAASSLAYLSIIYALSLTLQHIGKGLCIVLVFAQIPGASGLYPVELTSTFFQAIYPFFPFTYGIDALREAIGGFYGSHFVNDLVVLGIFFFGSLLAGILLQPIMSNVNRMFASQVRKSDLFNGEAVMTPRRPYRFSQVLHALSDREDFHQKLIERYERFMRRYPLFIRASTILIATVPVVLIVVFTLTTAEKAILLTGCVIWLVLLVVFLLVVESLRYSFSRQLHIDNMSNERLLGFFSNREKRVAATAGVTSSGASCEGATEADAASSTAPYEEPADADEEPSAAPCEEPADDDAASSGAPCEEPVAPQEDREDAPAETADNATSSNDEEAPDA